LSDLTKSEKWNAFEAFSNKAQHFGGAALVTRGLGGSSASIDAKQATYSLLYVKMVATFSDELIENQVSKVLVKPHLNDELLKAIREL